MATKIKFCGITSRPDADRAVAAGAWAIGLVLWPKSPRACDPDVAAEIAAEFKRRVEIVGVFVNPTLDEVTQAADAIGLTMVQLHGDEGPAFCAEVARRTGCKVIKAAGVLGRADLQALSSFHTDYHLLDSPSPGSGQSFDWELARSHRGATPMILSGGLTPDNVGEAIAAVCPFAVDVATGVERSPGHKDPRKLEAFAAAVNGEMAAAVK